MKAKLISILIIALTAIIILPGCKIEGCTDESAWNFDPDATSDDGTCVYKSLLSGTYNVNESCNSGGNYQYSMAISVNYPNIIITNFGDWGFNVTGTISAGNIIIPDQQVSAFGSTFNLSNVSGTCNTGTFSITYTISDGTNSGTCTMSGQL